MRTCMMIVARALQVIAWAVVFVIGSLVAVAGMWIYWVLVSAMKCDDGDNDECEFD